MKIRLPFWGLLLGAVVLYLAVQWLESRAAQEARFQQATEQHAQALDQWRQWSAAQHRLTDSLTRVVEARDARTAMLAARFASERRSAREAVSTAESLLSVLAPEAVTGPIREALAQQDTAIARCALALDSCRETVQAAQSLALRLRTQRDSAVSLLDSTTRAWRTAIRRASPNRLGLGGSVGYGACAVDGMVQLGWNLTAGITYRLFP